MDLIFEQLPKVLYLIIIIWKVLKCFHSKKVIKIQIGNVKIRIIVLKQNRRHQYKKRQWKE